MTGPPPPPEKWPRDGRNAGGQDSSEQTDDSTEPAASRFFNRLGLSVETGLPFGDGSTSWAFAIAMARAAIEGDRAEARRRVIAHLEHSCEIDRRQLRRIADCERELGVLARFEKYLEGGASDD